MVVLRSAWPSHPRITLTSTPASSRWTAAVWRNTCGLAGRCAAPVAVPADEDAVRKSELRRVQNSWNGPAEKEFAALTDQTSPSANILYRDIKIGKKTTRVSFILYYKNHADIFCSNDDLDYTNPCNQEYRVDIIEPAVRKARAMGLPADGPYPADTVFVRAMQGEFDVVVACYHDQGLIPVRLAAFGKAVNVTLGLPIVRTSVDHGTAFDIAGRGVADPGSMIAAVLLAAKLSKTINAETAESAEK